MLLCVNSYWPRHKVSQKKTYRHQCWSIEQSGHRLPDRRSTENNRISGLVEVDSLETRTTADSAVSLVPDAVVYELPTVAGTEPAGAATKDKELAPEESLAVFLTLVSGGEQTVAAFIRMRKCGWYIFQGLTCSTWLLCWSQCCQSPLQSPDTGNWGYRNSAWMC